METVRPFTVVNPKKTDDKPLGNPVKNAVITATDLLFGWQGGQTPILDIARFEIQKGEAVFIQGPSGGGKSTLLNLLAGVIVPQQGRVTVLGHGINTLHGSQRDRFRADHIGLIFQQFNLIPYLSVIENVTLPCLFSSKRRQSACKGSSSVENEAMRLLTRLGMAATEVIDQPVTELSVGQQQRVAAARALIGAPEIVIADEPTSSLDHQHREAFIKLLFAECRKTDATLIFVSHDNSLAPLFDRAITLGFINQAAQVVEPDEGGVQ